MKSKKTTTLVLFFVGAIAVPAMATPIWEDDMSDPSKFTTSWLNKPGGAPAGELRVEMKNRYPGDATKDGWINGAVQWTGGQLTPFAVSAIDEVTYKFGNITTKAGASTGLQNIFTLIHLADDTANPGGRNVTLNSAPMSFNGAGPFEETRTIGYAGTIDAIYWKFQYNGVGMVDKRVDLDHISITPEPATIGLLGVGAVMMALRRRRLA